MKLPSATIIHNLEQGTQEWFAARAGRATASRFAKILTPGGKLSKQADNICRVLARECIMDDPQEFKGNRYTEWGNMHEAPAREAWSAFTMMKVEQVGFCINNAHPVLGCSPDGLVVHDGEVIAGLEIKCPAIDTLVDWMLDLNGEIPKEYLPQVHGSMVVTGLRCWEFCGYHPGAPLYVANAEWNEYTDQLAGGLEEFVGKYAEIHKSVIAALGKEIA